MKQEGKENKAQSVQECSLFYCDRRRKSVCCFNCGYKPRCKNACQNHPKKCGMYLLIK